MPRKRRAGDDPRMQDAREEMIQGPSGVDLDAHDFPVRAMDLPLFRRKEDGDLAQALRLVVLGESVAGDVTFTVSDGDILLDSTRTRIDEGRTILDLFVPEVYEPSTFTLRVEAGDGEPFEAGVEVRPQRKWSVYLIHHSHLDIGYTDTQRSEACVPLVLARPQRQAPLGLVHGLAARERVHGGQPGRLGRGLPGSGRGVAWLSVSPRGAPLPVPGARGEHLRVDGVGSFFRSDQSAVSSRCTPPEGPGRFRRNASPSIVPAAIVREWN